MSGRRTSSKTRSGDSLCATLRPGSPASASTTWYPHSSHFWRRDQRTRRSSSTIRIFSEGIPYSLLRLFSGEFRRDCMGNRAGMPIVDNLLFGAMEAENAKSLTESSQHGRSHLLSLELRDQAYGNFRNKPRTKPWLTIRFFNVLVRLLGCFLSFRLAVRGWAQSLNGFAEAHRSASGAGNASILVTAGKRPWAACFQHACCAREDEGASYVREMRYLGSRGRPKEPIN